MVLGSSLLGSWPTVLQRPRRRGPAAKRRAGASVRLTVLVLRTQRAPELCGLRARAEPVSAVETASRRVPDLQRAARCRSERLVGNLHQRFARSKTTEPSICRLDSAVHLDRVTSSGRSFGDRLRTPPETDQPRPPSPEKARAPTNQVEELLLGRSSRIPRLVADVRRCLVDLDVRVGGVGGASSFVEDQRVTQTVGGGPSTFRAPLRPFGHSSKPTVSRGRAAVS